MLKIMSEVTHNWKGLNLWKKNCISETTALNASTEPLMTVDSGIQFQTAWAMMRGKKLLLSLSCKEELQTMRNINVVAVFLIYK